MSRLLYQVADRSLLCAVVGSLCCQALADKKVVANKENALAVISTLLEQGAGPAVEPILIDVSETGLFPILLDLFADKAKTVS